MRPERARKPMPQPRTVLVRVEPGYVIYRYGREFGEGETVHLRPRDADRLERNGAARREIG